MKRYIFFGYFFATSFLIFSQSEGEKLFRLNKPEAAIPVLEKEINQPDSDPVLYNYLGICYYQIKKYETAISIFETALSLPDSDTYTLNLNAGNTAFAMKNYSKALEYFNSASKAQPNNPTPILNRANSFLKLKRWGDAKVTYENFILVDPENEQTPKIKALIELLAEQIEKDRLAQEALAAQTELLDQNLARPKSETEESAALEKVEDGIVVATVVPPESELVDESLSVSKPVVPESEYIESEEETKNNSQIESEKVADQLSVKKSEIASSERIQTDEVPSPVKKTETKPVAKVVATKSNVISEQVESDQILEDQKKIFDSLNVAPTVEEPTVAMIESTRLSLSDLDNIKQSDAINCKIKILTEDFSPDNDGIDDSAEFLLSYNNAIQDPEQWEVVISDEGGETLKVFRGRGALPEKLVWNGLDEYGKDCIYSAAKYQVMLSVLPSASDARRSGVKAISDTQEMRSGILLIQTGEAEWKIIVMSFRFDADLETFDDLTPEQKKELENTLQAIVRQLKKHPECLISVDGYANNISGTEKENIQELIPLSSKRAEVIMKELIKRGIEASALSYDGKGGDNPIALRTDRKNWWKNRRVEFTLRLKTPSNH